MLNVNLVGDTYPLLGVPAGLEIRLRLACRPQARALFKPVAAILRAASAFLGSAAGST